MNENIIDIIDPNISRIRNELKYDIQKYRRSNSILADESLKS